MGAGRVNCNLTQRHRGNRENFNCVSPREMSNVDQFAGTA